MIEITFIYLPEYTCTAGDALNTIGECQERFWKVIACNDCSHCKSLLRSYLIEKNTDIGSEHSSNFGCSYPCAQCV